LLCFATGHSQTSLFPHSALGLAFFPLIFFALPLPSPPHSLVLLVLAWIPTVIIATSPGGAASLVGNAYFCTWINTVFVMETFIWFVHDLRKGVHSALQVKEREYQKFQQQVLSKSRALEAKRLASGSWGQNSSIHHNDDEAQDDIIELDYAATVVQLPTATMMAVLALPPPTHNYHHHPVFDLSRPQQHQPAPDNESSLQHHHHQQQQQPASPNMVSKDGTPRHTNIRRYRGPVGLDRDGLDDDGLLSDKDMMSSPQGSTVFFEADMDDDDVGEDSLP
jgi:hypothetical protein